MKFLNKIKRLTPEAIEFLVLSVGGVLVVGCLWLEYLNGY